MIPHRANDSQHCDQVFLMYVPEYFKYSCLKCELSSSSSKSPLANINVSPRKLYQLLVQHRPPDPFHLISSSPRSNPSPSQHLSSPSAPLISSRSCLNTPSDRANRHRIPHQLANQPCSSASAVITPPAASAPGTSWNPWLDLF